MWTLPEEGDYPRPSRYTGPAGHSSFVLEMSDPSQDEDSGPVTTTLTVAPESDPAAARTVDGVLATVHYHLVLSAGWGAVLADGGARAVGLDALAGVEGADAAAADLGPAVAVNGRASLSTNLLVTVPPAARGDPVGDRLLWSPRPRSARHGRGGLRPGHGRRHRCGPHPGPGGRESRHYAARDGRRRRDPPHDRTVFVFVSPDDAARRAVEPSSDKNNPYPYNVEANSIPLDQLVP